MIALSKSGARSEDVRDIVRDLRTMGHTGPGAIRQWLGRRFCFIRDPQGVELLKDPGVLLREWEHDGCARGDCDDAAILAAAVALAAGYQVRFQVVGFRTGGPFGHVYAEAFDGRRWIDFDVTRPAQFPAGLRVRRRLAFPIR